MSERTYFNQERKDQYIEENKERNNFLDKTSFNTFVRVLPMEQKLNKDACDFSSNEIISWYKSLNTTSMESLMSNNSQLKIYTAWCITHGFVKDNQNHYDEITIDTISDCLNKELIDKKVLSREQLVNLIEKEIKDNPSDKFLLLALFEGICGHEMSDLTMLKWKDFDVKNGAVRLYSGEIRPVSKRLIKYAEETQEEDIYYPYSDGTSASRVFKFKSTGEDDKLLRSLYNASVTDDLTTLRKRLYNKLVRIRKYTNVAGITQKALIDSGLSLIHI